MRHPGERWPLGRTRSTAGWIALLCAWPAWVCAAAEAEVDRDNGVLYLTATVAGPAPPADCYAVLTDFERLPDFVPGLRSSRVVSQPGEMLRVEQVGNTGPGLLGLTVRTTLALSLAPPAPGFEGRIEFSSQGGTLKQMHGTWRIRDHGAGCLIDYRATLEPDFPVPPGLGPFLMRRQVEGQLDAIAREIGRRQGANSPQR